MTSFFVYIRNRQPFSVQTLFFKLAQADGKKLSKTEAEIFWHLSRKITVLTSHLKSVVKIISSAKLILRLDWGLSSSIEPNSRILIESPWVAKLVGKMDLAKLLFDKTWVSHKSEQNLNTNQNFVHYVSSRKCSATNKLQIAHYFWKN
jgi:hypothetical protein